MTTDEIESEINKISQIIAKNNVFMSAANDQYAVAMCSRHTQICESMIKFLRSNDIANFRNAESDMDSFMKVYKTGKMLGN